MRKISIKLLSVILLASTFGFSACSKSDQTPKRPGGRSFVPATAEDVIATPGYKLEHTTKSGVQCYVYPITKDVAESFTIDSPEFRFLNDGDNPFLLIPIRDGKIIQLSQREAAEVSEFASKRSKK